MPSIINAGTTTATALNITTDTTGELQIQTSGVNAISISNGQVVSLANPLPPASGGTGITSLGAGMATFLGTPSSANLRATVTDETGSGALVFANAPALISPTITGVPTSTTAAIGTNTTQIATTAFVQAAIPSGVILLWSGSIATIPSGWLLCDGTSGTPDLRNRFIIGAHSDNAGVANTTITGSPTQTGGSKDAIVVSHTHTASVSDPGHLHSLDSVVGRYGFGGVYGVRADYPVPSAATLTATGSSGTGITVTNSTTGSSGTNANLPTYYALAYIMKA